MTNYDFIVTAKNAVKKNGEKSESITYTAPETVIERLKAAAAAISAYAVSTLGADIPDGVYAYNKAIWAAARGIDSIKKLKNLACIKEFQFTSADINFVLSMILNDDRTTAGRVKICGSKRAIQILLQVLYCKQNGVDYTCKERKQTEKKSVQTTTKAKTATKSKPKTKTKPVESTTETTVVDVA